MEPKPASLSPILQNKYQKKNGGILGRDDGWRRVCQRRRDKRLMLILFSCLTSDELHAGHIAAGRTGRQFRVFFRPHCLPPACLAGCDLFAQAIKNLTLFRHF